MRIFVGIDLSTEQKNKIRELQGILRNQALSGRWKHSDNFHLTLKFIGETEPAVLEKIYAALEEASRESEAFDMGLGGFDIFEGRESIRVLYLKTTETTGKLAKLQKDLETALAAIGIEPEKRSYRPHITIGQDIGFRKNYREVIQDIGTVHFPSIKVQSFFVFKSEQIANKRVYTKIREFRLQ